MAVRGPGQLRIWAHLLKLDFLAGACELEAKARCTSSRLSRIIKLINVGKYQFMQKKEFAHAIATPHDLRPHKEIEKNG